MEEINFMKTLLNKSKRDYIERITKYDKAKSVFL